MTTIDERDYKVIYLVSEFKQLTSMHIRELLFHDLASPTPCKRTLRRLVERKYLAPMEWRLIGGMRGGSGQLVYQLGPAGWRMLRTEPYRPARAISYHTLEVGHTYLELVRLERAGRFKISGYAVESEAWITVNGFDVRPDLYVETQMPDGHMVKSNLEIDLGSEGEKQLRGKLAAYVYAFNHVDAAQFPIWPRTVWIVPDELRARQLRRLINQLPEDEQQLFKVCIKAAIAEMFP